jgi:hypothetical protein
MLLLLPPLLLQLLWPLGRHLAARRSYRRGDTIWHNCHQLQVGMPQTAFCHAASCSNYHPDCQQRHRHRWKAVVPSEPI